MKNLNAVSETALLTLKARITEAKKKSPVIDDKKGIEILEKIRSHIPNDTHKRILDRKLPSTLTSYLALRSRKYDLYTTSFIEKNPNGLVVSLGCGFDTRYWRISGIPDNYMEIDLPEVVELKKEILGNSLEYDMIGSSVLDTGWLDQVTSRQTTNVLFLVEGLLMYLPEQDVIRVFQRLSGTFSNSMILFEVVHKKYTKGIWKKIVESKMKRKSGSSAGSSFQYGIKEACEIESYADNLKVEEEWSYFEDPDIKPGFQYMFRHIKAFSRTQWTIGASIE